MTPDLYLNCEDNNITLNKKNYLMRAARRLGINNVYEYKSGVSVANVLNIEPYSELISGTHWTGAWWVDTLLDNPRFNSEFPYISTIFLAGNSFKINKQDNHRILFQAIDSEIHRPLPVEKECDFILAGALGLDIYKTRETMINALRKEGFSFIGAGKDFKPEAYVQQLNRARVQFIRSMDVDGHGEIAQRFFECLAIGPVLTNWVPDLIHTGLVEGVDYLSYNTEEEAIFLMHKLLNEPNYAHQIALNGQYKARLYHTYEHRLITILEEINEYTLFK